jgi:hypothetical protein
MEIHCHTCGGFISEPSTISFQLPQTPARVAEPRTGLCTCGAPTVYGPPPGHSSSPGMPGAGYLTL